MSLRQQARLIEATVPKAFADRFAEAGMRALHDAPLASLDRSYARLMASFPKAGETM